MSQPTLSIKPEEATKNILNKLPGRRMRHVLEKRFGLHAGRKHTLESIGNEYKITRERVRQIESEALKHLRKDSNLSEIREPLEAVGGHINNQGGVMAEQHLFTSLVNSRSYPHLVLLLSVAPNFHFIPETQDYHARWAVGKESALEAEKVVAGAVGYLNDGHKTVSKDELYSLLGKYAREVLGETAAPNVIEAHLATSKLIRPNPYGEYGLSSWASIRPRGIKDKAYAVLVKSGRPLHFREVATAITKAGWSTPHAACTFKSERRAQCKLCAGSKKKAHPQTVHNELIKDARFVLVGRGLYGLREWGYEPGLVRDVLVSVLKQAGNPLGKDKIIELVSEKRIIKPQTILLNLQNKALFKRTEDGKYTLV